MKYLCFVPILALSFHLAFAGDCMSDGFNQKCLHKSELEKGWHPFMNGGDPCFLYSDKRYCFVAPGSLQPCSCTPDCGCTGDFVAPPKCDNSAVPQTQDCDPKYCDDKKTYGEDNTMCLYCGPDYDMCGSVCQYGLTREEQEAILNKHNELRSRVAMGLEKKGFKNSQPKAANMFKMEWDEELAVVAQRWVEQCKFDHDKNAKTATYPSVGQNVAMSEKPTNLGTNDMVGFVQDWYDEVKDFNPIDIKPYSQANANGTVDHYTQVVWATSVKVGCGFIHFNKDNVYKKQLVCNYAEAGNLIGGTMYEVGETASQCPGKSENGLCL